MLPRDSAFRTASMSSFGGLLIAESRLNGRGDGVFFLMSVGSAALAASYAFRSESAVGCGVGVGFDGVGVGAFMIGIDSDEFDPSRKLVPSWNGPLCIGMGSGRDDGPALLDDAYPGAAAAPLVETNAGLPIFPMLALLTSLLSSPSSSSYMDDSLPLSTMMSSKKASGSFGLYAKGDGSPQLSGIAALDANDVCDLVRGLSSGIGETNDAFE